MIEGTVEAVDNNGVFRGWLRDTSDLVPALIQIRLGGQVVAECLAAGFRPDLLRQGHGHGHYGFLARARVAVPPGVAGFELFLPRHDQGIPVRLGVPSFPAPSPVPVEALLQPEPAWTVSDLAGAVPCLGLAVQHAAMGTPRFVDVSFQFVLRRWPLVEEAAVYILAIEEGSLSADAFMAELLAARERADLGGGLPSPWDAGFPFAPDASGEPKAARPVRGGAGRVQLRAPAPSAGRAASPGARRGKPRPELANSELANSELANSELANSELVSPELVDKEQP